MVSQKTASLILFFGVLVCFSIIISGCARPGAPADEAADGAALEAETGDEYALSASAKTNALLAQGELSATDAALFELVAAYAHDTAPRAIAPEEGAPNLMWAENHIVNNWDSFSEKERRLLLPFYVLPDDPRSVHGDAQTKVQAVADALTVLPSVLAANDAWALKRFVIDAQRRATVRYKNTSANDAQAGWIGAAFLRAYPLHETLLGLRLANDVTVYIVEMAPYGSATMRVEDGAQRCVVKVRSGLDKQTTEATVAHELFHCFQFAIPLKYEKKDMMWLMEATATWAEHNVYPSHNSEWEYHPGFFRNVGGNLLYYGETREYGTYVWILYLSQRGGAGAVKDLLVRAKTAGATQAVLATPDYEERFKEYGYYVWNQGIAHRLSDSPDFPSTWPDGSERRPSGKRSYYKLNTPRGIEQDLGLSLSVLSHYYTHLIIDSSVKSVVFTMELPPDSAHPIQALLKTGEGWYYEDFDGLTEKRYCLDDDTRIEEIVLILSNSQKETFRPKIMLSTKEECEPEWSGHYTVTWSARKTDRTQGPGGGATITNGVDATYRSRETLVYDAERGSFSVTSARVDYESHTQKRIDYDGGDCERYDQEDGVMTGGHTYDFSNDAFPPSRMSFSNDDEITGPLSFIVNPVTEQGIRWIHYVEKKSVLPCTLPSDGPRDPKVTTFEDDYDNLALPIDDEAFQIDVAPGVTVIEGERTLRARSDQYGDYDVTVAYSYRYD